jgi:hypothetical protein
VRAASVIRKMIALMMEASRTYEKSADIYLTTRQYIPEDSELDLKWTRIGKKAFVLTVLNVQIWNVNVFFFTPYTLLILEASVPGG